MATDATGTPTSLGIPKFNTAVDAPSGKGSNAQMDSIDALLVGRAPLNSPSFTGVPLSVTPPALDNTTKIATTAWVNSNGSVQSVAGKSGVVTLVPADVPGVESILSKVLVPQTLTAAGTVGLSVSVPGNTVGPNGAMRLRFCIHGNAHAVETVTLTFKIGATTIKQTVLVNPNSADYDGEILVLSQGGTTGSTSQLSYVDTRNGATAWWVASAPVSSAVDMTAAQTVSLLVNLTGGSGGTTGSVTYAVLELLP